MDVREAHADHDASGDEHQLHFRLMNEIAIVAQLSQRLFERVMTDGMTMPQFGVLNHFVRLGRPSTPLTLAAAFQVTKSTMTNTLHHLERKAYVSVAGHPTDGRAKLIDITAAGRAAHARTVADLGPSLIRLASAIPSEDVGNVLPTLTAVRRYLDAERDAPASGGSA